MFSTGHKQESSFPEATPFRVFRKRSRTFVSDDSQVETDPNAPEELRACMQQTIDEFMGSPTEAQKPLEYDV
ncbi:hypothetical protein DPMN_030810 [Dreissena polymorpha]|uniref:Uncharacterized protein n=1 Tax=Dreissena polymorpha TaxID=45954 RepID=A0A9D4M1G3_DREPO|nr:hypothetical protein DPMN_030810 [Dreissena polymorpha]